MKMPHIVVLHNDRLYDVISADRIVTIGRKRFNNICLPHRSVSASHAQLTFDEGRVMVEDMKSRGGTFLGKERISSPKELIEGTTLHIGPYDIYVHKSNSHKPEGNPPPKNNTSLLYKRLESIFDLEEQLNANDSAGDLLAQSLAALMDVLGARRGIVFLEKKGKLCPLTILPTQKGELLLSQRLLEHLRELNGPTLVDDVAVDPRTHQLDSIAVEVASIIASPISCGMERLGLLYLESSERNRPFSGRDLNFLDRFCRYASNVISRAGEIRRLDHRSRNLFALHRLELDRLHGITQIIGESSLIKGVRQQITEVAPTDVTTLITGETGTGKELVARAIHLASPRHNGPFVPVNCQALPTELVESELFGHRKGAFSGATEDRVGRFEMANGGTLFLDEVGELEHRIQVKLLRVLEERCYERVGEGKSRKADLRLLCATNTNLETAVREGHFRQDLYYRLCVYPITLPPLRERIDDILLLCTSFIKHFNRTMGRKIEGVTTEAQERLQNHSWPGNVRELRNSIQQAFVRCNGKKLNDCDFPGLDLASPLHNLATVSLIDRYPGNLEQARLQFEHELAQAYLKHHGGNVSAAARALSTSRRNLYKKLKILSK